MEKYPFSNLHVNSSAFLDDLSGRSKCPKCQRSRKYYCYTCYIAVPEVASRVPKVKLPVKVDIIKHPSEVDGKSTAVHAGVIAPDDVTIYTYPCIPDYMDKDKVVLVFPGENSVTLDQLAEKIKTTLTDGKSGKSDVAEHTGKRSENHSDGSSKRKADTELPEVPTNKNSKLIKCADVKGDDKCQIKLVETGLTIQQPRETTAVADDSKCCVVENGDNVAEASFSKLESDGKSCVSAQHRSSSEKDKSTDYYCQEQSAAETGSSAMLESIDCALPIERVVFVDSTWNQTRSICGDERLKDLTCVELKSRESRFWRMQRDIPSTYLSTIEALYYFMVDFHLAFLPDEYCGQYDNLLFFFCFMYNKIRSLHDGGGELKAYKQRRGRSEQN